MLRNKMLFSRSIVQLPVPVPGGEGIVGPYVPGAGAIIDTDVSALSHATVIEPLTDRLRVSALSHATVIEPLTDRLRVSALSHAIVISPV